MQNKCPNCVWMNLSTFGLGKKRYTIVRSVIEQSMQLAIRQTGRTCWPLTGRTYWPLTGRAYWPLTGRTYWPLTGHNIQYSMSDSAKGRLLMPVHFTVFILYSMDRAHYTCTWVQCVRPLPNHCSLYTVYIYIHTHHTQHSPPQNKT